MSQDAKTKRVVVIGAGASGIGAARTLSAAGAEVIILEGRDRIGGRMRKHCLTKNLSKSSGLEAGADHFVNIQLGANWIHGMEATTNPMFEVAQKLGLELHQTSSDDDPGDDVILFDSGDFKLATASDSDKLPTVGFSRVSKEDYHESLSRYEWIKEYVDHIQFNYEKEDISLQAAFDLALQASESEIFGPCSAPQRRCLNWMYDRVSIDLGAHISKVSLNCYAEGVSDGQGGEALVKHIGYSGILDYLAREFPLDIRLNRQVASIAVCNATDSGDVSIFESPSEEELARVKSDLDRCVVKDGHYVRVTCTDGEVLVCDACVVTVPVGALQAQSISFVPRPPSVITSVCASLKLGLMNLVWLWYPFVFWPEECNFLGVARDRDAVSGSGVSGDGEDNTVVKFSTFLVPPVFDNFGVRQPVLMCQIVGPYATTIESMSDADIAAEATATLRRMFGAQANVPDALGCAHSSWGSDPNARGSWSYFPYRPTETATADTVGITSTSSVGVSGHAGGVVDSAVLSQGVHEVEQGGAPDTHEGVFEGVQAGCGEQASVGTGVGGVVRNPINTSAALAQAPQLPAHSTTAANATTAATSTVYATTTTNGRYEDGEDVSSTTSGTSSPATGPTTTTTAGGLSPLSHPSVRIVMHAPANTTTTTTTVSHATSTTNTSIARAAIKGRSLHSPLRSVTISEAAALVVPHTTRAHTRRYSSTGYTSEASDVSTDSDDSDSSSDDEYEHEYGHSTTHTTHSTRTTHFDLTASSSDEGVLRRSEDDILSSHVCYASEAMSVLNRGTVHGAYLSGIREANKILAFLEERK